MGARRVWLLALVGVCAGCSGAKHAAREPADPGTGGSGFAAQQAPGSEESESRRYVDPSLGFELMQPGGDWTLDQTDEQTPEGLAIPVVLRHRASGAQIVLQVAPAVATPAQFAERLTVGLRSQPGFVTSEPEPLAMSDNAVGFHFAVGDNVRGRVVVRDGSPGKVFMMLATWPTAAPEDVPAAVNALFESVRPLPVTPHQT